MLTWLLRFEAIQELPNTSMWLWCALETLKEQDPEQSVLDTELLWKVSKIRLEENQATAEQNLQEIGMRRKEKDNDSRS